MTVEETYIRAAKNLRMVELVDRAGEARIVEPYMVYIATTGERLLHCYRLGGAAQAQNDPPTGWWNPLVSNFTDAHELFAGFRVRPDYNPDNRKIFAAVIFAVPKPDSQSPSS